MQRVPDLVSGNGRLTSWMSLETMVTPAPAVTDIDDPTLLAVATMRFVRLWEDQTAKAVAALGAVFDYDDHVLNLAQRPAVKAMLDLVPNALRTRHSHAAVAKMMTKITKIRRG